MLLLILRLCPRTLVVVIVPSNNSESSNGGHRRRIVPNSGVQTMSLPFGLERVVAVALTDASLAEQLMSARAGRLLAQPHLTHFTIRYNNMLPYS